MLNTSRPCPLIQLHSYLKLNWNILYSLDQVNCGYKMRYQNEIEDILRISQEYDNNTNTIHDVLLNLNWEGNCKSNDLTSLGHKLTQLVALCRLRNETIKFVLNCSQVGKVYSKVCKEPSVIPDKMFLGNLQEKILTQLTESEIQLDIYNVRIKQLREEVKATLIACGHCDPTYLLPYLEVGNQDQIPMLQILLQWVYPNGRSQCSNPKVIETEATTELPNMSLDSKAIETEATKNDMVTVDLNTQDTQLNPKPNPMPKKTMTPRQKFKRIKKSGKVQKIQNPRVYKKKLKTQLDMRAQWSKKVMHNNKERLHNNTLNTKFIELRGIMKSVIGAFHNTFPLQNRLLLQKAKG